VSAPALRRAVVDGASVRATLATLSPAVLDVDDPRITTSINTPADVAAASDILGGDQRRTARDDQPPIADGDQPRIEGGEQSGAVG
jgi:hypothetical protein